MRAVLRKNALSRLLDWQPDVICLQEVKSRPDQIPEEEREIPGFSAFWNPAERPGYSGVLTYSLTLPEEVKIGLGEEEFDREGRVIRTDWQADGSRWGDCGRWKRRSRGKGGGSSAGWSQSCRQPGRGD